MKRARRLRRLSGFTLVELLIVMAIIIVLAGLVVATSGYVQEKGKRSRTEAEIAAMSAALESYKADNGIYPTDSITEMANPTATPVSKDAGKRLYQELSGDQNLNGTPSTTVKSYMPFKPTSLLRAIMSQPVSSGNVVTAIRDPFGNAYGYSTAKAAGKNFGFNPTFDLWSTAGTSGVTANDQAKWIKNW